MKLSPFCLAAKYSTPPAADASAPSLLIAAALLIGALLGAIAPIPEHRAVEGSLVLAGMIKYVSASPQGAYFTNSWTSIHQVGALLLHAGLDQVALNRFFSVVPAATMVAAYAMIIFGICQRPFFAALAAPLCYLKCPLSIHFASPDYALFGEQWPDSSAGHSFGLWGQVGAVWVLGCVAANRKGLALFSAMVLVCIHPVLGTYMFALVMFFYIALGALGFLTPADLRQSALGMLGGLAITATSFVVYLAMRQELIGAPDPAAYDAYIRFWDDHRNVPLTGTDAVRVGAAAVAAVSVFCAAILTAVSRHPDAARSSVVVTSVFMVLLIIVSTPLLYVVHLAPDLLPDLIFRSIPGRLLNVQAYAITPAVAALMVFFIESAFAKDRSGFSRPSKLMRLPPASRLFAAFRFPLLAPTVVVVLLLAVVGARVFHSFTSGLAYQWFIAEAPSQASARDETDRAFWRAVRAASINGLVLATTETVRSGLYHGHLPVALDVSAFDYVPYLPATARAVSRIVEDAYGIPFFSPPPEMQKLGGLLDDSERPYWAKLTTRDWSRIARTFGIGAVIAPTKWALGLPVLVSGPDFSLYVIPAEESDPLREGAH